MSSTFSSSRRHKHGVSYSHCQDRWHRPSCHEDTVCFERIDTSAVRNLREFERNSTHHNHRIPWNCTKKEQLRKAALFGGGHGIRRSQKHTNVEIPRMKSADHVCTRLCTQSYDFRLIASIIYIFYE